MMPRAEGRPPCDFGCHVKSFRHELHATATMLVAEHGRAAINPVGWQVAVVLPNFVAVLMLQAWVTRPSKPAPSSWDW
jgi:hypothetical protein